MIRRFLLLCAVTMGLCAATRADVKPLLEQAAAAYDEGARLLPRDEAGARAAFARSAQSYRDAVAELGETSAPPQLIANMASATFLAGDTGSAILWLRRAARTAPNDARIQADLGIARQRVAMPVPRADGTLQQFTILEFVPARVRLWTGIACFAGAWTLALLRILAPGGRRPGRMLVGAAALGALLAGVSLVPRELRLRDTAEAVVMKETIGRAGPDASAYEPKPASPLKAGAEVRVVEERGSWTLIELGDATTSWVETTALERVGPIAG